MNKNAKNVGTVHTHTHTHTGVLDNNKKTEMYERDIDKMPQIVMQRKNEN